ncbi:MAG: group 1 truncated hemoglobin [Candidatus Schekmanbacteria bacterium]|nr:group 1 truncated hemoglobin [Candidatus Schekmanbacteria bacterium]
MSQPTPFARVGGEEVLRTIIDDFVDRCFADVWIGFLFRNANRARIKTFEYQHAAAFLGAGTEYEGRPLDVAHGRHHIAGGQFMRRLQILRETLDDHGVPPPVRDAWIEHNESLRAVITRDLGAVCHQP